MGHCWRSRDDLISDVLLGTPSHGQAKAGQPARTYIRQLCANTGCSFEDLLEAMDGSNGWRRVAGEGQGYDDDDDDSSFTRMALTLNYP